MTDDRCRWNGSGNPRTVPGRHDGDCTDGACRGCALCPSAHCRVCGITHAVGTCAECLAEVRDNLREIGRLCDALPEEVEHRGVEGEAMMLLAPAADYEARGHMEASVRAGRVPPEYFEAADGELHPLFVLGSWDALWRDALDHSEPEERVTLPTLIDYLDRTMAYMGGFEHVPFEDFAGDLRRCRSHLEAVLQDGEQIDRGAPCMTCGKDLQRIWNGEPLPWSDLHPQIARHDGWACRRCRTTSTEAQYDLAVKADYIARADWLPAEDMTTRTGVKASTVRSWASDKRERGALIRKTLRAERVVYSVEDVEREKERAA